MSPFGSRLFWAVCSLALLSSSGLAGVPISQKGLGPLRFGMTLEQAKQMLPKARFKEVTDWENDEYTELRLDGNPIADLYFERSEGSKAVLREIRVTGAGCATVEGIHPGSSIQEAIQVWGPLTSSVQSDANDAIYLRFSRSPAWLTIAKSAEGGCIAYFVLHH